MKKRVLSLVLVMVLVFALIPINAVAATGIMRDITAAELVADIKIGTNHYRALGGVDWERKVGYKADPYPDNGSSKIVDLTLFGEGLASSVPSGNIGDKRNGVNEIYSLQMFSDVIQDFKDAGYNAVRLPVSWTLWTNDTTFAIDKDWMDLVESAVKIIYDKGMYCIINAHDDYLAYSWVGDKWEQEWLREEYKTYVDSRFTSIWKQIAERFKNYSDYLIFESFNEPFAPDIDNSLGVNRVNELQAAFVKTVRDTGGNNAKRFLSLTHYCAGRYYNLDGIKLPNDDRLIVQVHYYYTKADNDFSVVTSWNRNNETNRKRVDDVFATIEQFMDKTNVPVILGEFGSTASMPTRDRIDYATYILEKATALGIPAFCWETTLNMEVDKQNKDEWALYNRDKLDWEYPDIVKAMMGAVSNKSPSQPTTSTATDKPFNSKAQTFLNALPAEAKKGIAWTRKSFNGIEFIEAYRDDGTKKPIIFFLHGGGSSKEEVMGALDMYAHEGFYAVALDAAGCGDSQVGPIMAYKSFEVTVGYIDSLVEYYKTVAQTDADSFAVGGGSMGGTISFCYAAHGKYKPKVILPDMGTPDLLLNSDGPMFDCFDKGKSGQPRTMTDAELRAFAAEYSPIKTPERFMGIAIYARNGLADDITPPTGSKNLESELKKLGHTDMVFYYYDGGHGDPFTDNADVRLKFIKEHISKPTSSPSVPTTPNAPAAPTATATPTNTAFMLNDTQVSLPAYLIDGNNYVKLRDVAALLETRFEVLWQDGKAKLYNKTEYTPVGGELADIGAGAQTATPSNTDFVWGDSGEAVTGLTAYLIGGNNYIKLRDIAKLFDFDVDWRDGKAWIEPDISPYTED